MAGTVTVLDRTSERKIKALEPEHPPGDHKITMSNALTRAAHNLSLPEKRIVLTAAAKLDSRTRPAPGVVPVTKITAAEYAETFGLDPTTAYEQLKDGTKELYQRSITFFEAAHRRRGKALAQTRVTMRWIGRAKYHDGEGWVEVHWWHEVLPHLTGLRRQFTTYQLQQASALRSVYSWKLLELLMRFQSSGWAEYTIEDFAEAMEATEKQRANFAAIRRKIIEPAVKELTAKDGWVIEWKPIKAGRRVVSLRFDFERHPQGRLALDEPKQPSGKLPLALDETKPTTKLDKPRSPPAEWDETKARLIRHE